jgi:hypothetical protein
MPGHQIDSTSTPVPFEGDAVTATVQGELDLVPIVAGTLAAPAAVAVTTPDGLSSNIAGLVLDCLASTNLSGQRQP